MSNINLPLCNLNPITPRPNPQWNQKTILPLSHCPTPQLEKVSGQFMAWLLPVEVAPLSTVTQAQGKTERKIFWHSALIEMIPLDCTWVCDGWLCAQRAWGSKMGLQHVPSVLSYCTRGECGTQGCLGRREGRLQGTSDIWSDGRGFTHCEGPCPHPCLQCTHLNPAVPTACGGGLPHCVRPCHRCASLCATGAMQPPGADPHHLRPPIQTFSFKPS